MFDLVQAIGGILNVRWAHNGIVTTGPYCTAQGLVQQIGDTGVALMTLVCPLPYGLSVCYPLIYTLPVSGRPYFRSSCVGSWPRSAWLCPWPGLSCLHFHCALGWHRQRHSQELYNAFTRA